MVHLISESSDLLKACVPREVGWKGVRTHLSIGHHQSLSSLQISSLSPSPENLPFVWQQGSLALHLPSNLLLRH